MKNFYENNKFKYQVQYDEFESPDESHYVSDIQDYFKYIVKKLEKLAERLCTIY